MGGSLDRLAIHCDRLSFDLCCMYSVWRTLCGSSNSDAIECFVELQMLGLYIDRNHKPFKYRVLQEILEYERIGEG